MSMGAASVHSPTVLPKHLRAVDPFHFCQHQLPPASPCVYITTPLYPRYTQTHTLTYIIGHNSPVLSQHGSGPAWDCLPHKSPLELSRRESAGSHHLFSSPLSYYPHISPTNSPKLSQFSQQLKHFSHSPFLSSVSSWQDAQPCRSGRLGAPGPKLTQPICGGNRDLTNKRNRGLLSGGRLGFEQQWESHRACHCFSTTDRFLAAVWPFLSETQRASLLWQKSHKRDTQRLQWK